MSWFRVSVSASQTLLANVAPLCQGLAKYAGFDQHEAPQVGALLQQALGKAIGQGESAEPLVELVCQTTGGQFEARVSRQGQIVERIVRPLTKAG